MTAGHSIPFAEAVRVWLRIGLTSFGGPAGQIATMHRVLVDEKRWIGEARFLHALNYCMLLPGPEAQQLATYVGWLLHRIPGGLVAGLLFVMPGFLAIMALSVLYAAFNDLTVVQGLFFGLKPAVLAVVVEAVLRIGKRALKNRMMVLLAAFAFVAIFFFEAPFPAIVLGAGVIGYVGAVRYVSAFAAVNGAEAGVVDTMLEEKVPDHVKPSLRRAAVLSAIFLTLWAAPVLAAAAVYGADGVFVAVGIFFSKMAVVTFGGAYAVLAYVAQQAVEVHGWLLPGEMLDGLGMAETTPGPLIMVLQFVGFLAGFRNPGPLDPMTAGVLAAVLTVWVTFVPCFLWIFLGGPYMEAVRGNKALAGALTAITAAVVGVILNLSVWFALHVIFRSVGEIHVAGLRLLVPDAATLDLPSLVLAAAAMVAMFRFRLGMVPTLAASAALGMAWRLLA